MGSAKGSITAAFVLIAAIYLAKSQQLQGFAKWLQT